MISAIAICLSKMFGVALTLLHISVIYLVETLVSLEPSQAGRVGHGVRDKRLLVDASQQVGHGT